MLEKNQMNGEQQSYHAIVDLSIFQRTVATCKKVLINKVGENGWI
jgi:hypothetical protein